MTENEARKLGVSIEWNGRANVCVHCGKVPETFYVATGHDHTDYDIRWCPCREPNPNWCAGCSPDNCSGCVAESVESEPAVNECRLTLIHQIHELADHIERAAPSVTDSDMRKQMLGQREYALKASAKWNMNGNPFSPQPDRVAELEAALKVAREAIEAQQNGLKWYQDAYPDSISEADYEEANKIEEAIAKINEVLYD